MPSMNADTFYKEMGELIKTERVKRGMSQEIIAEQLDLTRASVINLEKGRHKPSVYQLLMIAEILNTDYGNLIPVKKEKPQVAKKDILNNINKAIIDQDSMDKNTKEVLVEFLTSIKEH